MVSDKVQSLDELCQKYGEFSFLVGGVKHHELTLEDFALINRILIGCTKLAYIHKQECIDLYTSGGHLGSRKLFGGILAFDYVLNFGKSNSVFRPKDIRASFPEYIQNLSFTDLSRILRNMKKTRLIKTAMRPDKKVGRPRQEERGTPKTKFYYTKSDYLLSLKNLITKPLVRSILFSILLESKVIQRYLEYTCLFVLYEIKFSGLEHALKTLEVTERLDSKILSIYKKNLSNLTKIVNKSEPKRIKSIAHKMANEQLRLRDFKNDSLYNYYYVMGGIFYYG